MDCWVNRDKNDNTMKERNIKQLTRLEISPCWSPSVLLSKCYFLSCGQFSFSRGMPLSSVLYILFGHPMRPCSYSVFFITLSNVGGCNSFHMRNSHCVSFAGQTFGHLSKNWFHQPLPVNFFAASAPLFLSTVCRTILITGHLVLGQLISVCYYR